MYLKYYNFKYIVRQDLTFPEITYFNKFSAFYQYLFCFGFWLVKFWTIGIRACKFNTLFSINLFKRKLKKFGNPLATFLLMSVWTLNFYQDLLKTQNIPNYFVYNNNSLRFYIELIISENTSYFIPQLYYKNTITWFPQFCVMSVWN